MVISMFLYICFQGVLLSLLFNAEILNEPVIIKSNTNDTNYHTTNLFQNLLWIEEVIFILPI